MNMVIALSLVALFFAGLLAGALLVIDYGVGPAVAAVSDQGAHLQVRQALILTLRILIPAIFVPTILLGIAVTVLDRSAPGFGFRLAGLFIVLLSFGFTLAGTGPINSTVLTWNPGAPPEYWQAMIQQWERFDRARTWAAITAFVSFLAAIALRLAAR